MYRFRTAQSEMKFQLFVPRVVWAMDKRLTVTLYTHITIIHTSLSHTPHAETSLLTSVPPPSAISPGIVGLGILEPRGMALKANNARYI